MITTTQPPLEYGLENYPGTYKEPAVNTASDTAIQLESRDLPTNLPGTRKRPRDSSSFSEPADPSGPAAPSAAKKSRTAPTRPNPQTYYGTISARMMDWVNHTRYFPDTQGNQKEINFLTSDVRNCLNDIDCVLKGVMSNASQGEIQTAELLEHYYRTGQTPHPDDMTEQAQMVRTIVHRALEESGKTPLDAATRRDMVQGWSPREGMAEWTHRVGMVIAIPAVRNFLSVLLPSLGRETLAYSAYVPGPVGTAAGIGYLVIQGCAVLRLVLGIAKDFYDGRASLQSTLAKGAIATCLGVTFAWTASKLQSSLATLFARVLKVMVYTRWRDLTQSFMPVTSSLPAPGAVTLGAALGYPINQTILAALVTRFAKARGTSEVSNWFANGMAGPKPARVAMENFFFALFNWAAEWADDETNFLLSALLENAIRARTDIHPRTLVVKLGLRCPGWKEIRDNTLGIGADAAVNSTREGYFQFLNNADALLEYYTASEETRAAFINVFTALLYPTLPYAGAYKDDKEPHLPNIITPREHELSSTHVVITKNGNTTTTNVSVIRGRPGPGLMNN